MRHRDKAALLYFIVILASLANPVRLNYFADFAGIPVSASVEILDKGVNGYMCGTFRILCAVSGYHVRPEPFERSEGLKEAVSRWVNASTFTDERWQFGIIFEIENVYGYVTRTTNFEGWGFPKILEGHISGDQTRITPCIWRFPEKRFAFLVVNPDIRAVGRDNIRIRFLCSCSEPARFSNARVEFTKLYLVYSQTSVEMLQLDRKLLTRGVGVMLHLPKLVFHGYELALRTRRS